MADNNRSPRPSNSNRGTGNNRGTGTGKPASRSTTGRDSRGGKPDSRGGKPDSRSGGSRDSRGGQREDRSGDKRPARKDDWRRPPGEQLSRTEDQARYDGPDIPEDITGKELDRSVTAQLKGLPEKLAARVA